MAKSNSTSMLLGGALVVFVLLVGYTAFKNYAPSPNDAFAQCLTEKGVKMYGAWWCPHCTAQKAVFGTAFDHVTYVECSPNGSRTMSQECQDAKITGYPTWEFADGTRLGGEQTLETLGTRAGCELPQ